MVDLGNLPWGFEDNFEWFILFIFKLEQASPK